MFNRYNRPVLLLGLAVTLLGYLLVDTRPWFLEHISRKIYDVQVATTATSPPSRLPVIIDIDEATLTEFGQWPWPRYRLALLLTKIKELDPSVTALELVLPEPDSTSLKKVRATMYRDLGIDIPLPPIPAPLADNDLFLLKALEEDEHVLGYTFLFDQEIRRPADCSIHPLPTVEQSSEAQSNPLAPLEATGVVCNLPQLSEQVAASGFFNLFPDTDGVYRKAPLLISYNGTNYPSLALSAVLKYLGKDQVHLRTGAGGGRSLCIGNTCLPVNQQAEIFLRFHGPVDAYETISAGDILKGLTPLDALQGRIVFVGNPVNGLNLTVPTPTDPAYSAVQLHAAVVDNIVSGDVLSRPPWAGQLELLLTLAAGIVSTLFLCLTGAWPSFVFLVATVGSLILGTEWLFNARNVVFSPLYPLLIIGTNFSLLILFKYWREEARSKESDRLLLLTQEITIEGLGSLVEYKDPETGGHIKRTQNYVRLLAEQVMSHDRFRHLLDPATTDLLFKCAPLHDIGKVGVPDHILLKPGKLTPEEFEEMKQHTIYGYKAITVSMRKLGENSFLHLAGELVYTHHEKWDGSGYPRGLKGDEIPLPGRLMALADVYDALISKRVYKSPMPHDRALEIIREGRESHFDPDLVDAFLAVEDRFRRIALRWADHEEERRLLSKAGR